MNETLKHKPCLSAGLANEWRVSALSDGSSIALFSLKTSKTHFIDFKTICEFLGFECSFKEFEHLDEASQYAMLDKTSVFEQLELR